MLVGMTTDLVPSIGYSTNNSGMLLGNPSQTEECSPEVATIECFENFIHSRRADFEFIPFEILRIIVAIVPVFYVESQIFIVNYFTLIWIQIFIICETAC